VYFILYLPTFLYEELELSDNFLLPVVFGVSVVVLGRGFLATVFGVTVVVLGRGFLATVSFFTSSFLEDFYLSSSFLAYFC
jgi:hypothetical protein